MEERMFLQHAQTLLEQITVTPSTFHVQVTDHGSSCCCWRKLTWLCWAVSARLQGWHTWGHRVWLSTYTGIFHITGALLQHPTERFSKALRSTKALTFENKTQTSLALVHFLHKIPSIIFFGYSTFCCCLVRNVWSRLWDVYHFTDVWLLFSHRYMQPSFCLCSSSVTTKVDKFALTYSSKSLLTSQERYSPPCAWLSALSCKPGKKINCVSLEKENWKTFFEKAEKGPLMDLDCIKAAIKYHAAYYITPAIFIE